MMTRSLNSVLVHWVVRFICLSILLCRFEKTLAGVFTNENNSFRSKGRVGRNSEFRGASASHHGHTQTSREIQTDEKDDNTPIGILHTGESFIEIPPIIMRIDLSLFRPDLHSASLRNELKNLTTDHITEFYKSYIQNGNATDMGVEGASFDRFFLSVTIKSDDELSDRHGDNDRNRKQSRNLLSTIIAEFNGYAIYHSEASIVERKIIEDLPTLMFLGENHQQFLQKLQTSKDEALSSVVQISVVSKIDTRQKIGNGGIQVHKKSNRINKNDGKYDLSVRTILLFVFGCFFVGVAAGGLFIQKFSKYLDNRRDDETVETSKGSSNGEINCPTITIRKETRPSIMSHASNAAEIFINRIFLRGSSTPTDSISIDNIENLHGHKMHENQSTKSYRVNVVLKPRKKRVKSCRSSRKMTYKNFRERKNNHDRNSLTSIAEESEGDLYSDFVDDIVMDQIQKKGSLFPTLQDRLSNVRTKHLCRKSSDEIEYIDTYMPTKCAIMNEKALSETMGTENTMVTILSSSMEMASRGIYKGELEEASSENNDEWEGHMIT